MEKLWIDKRVYIGLEIHIELNCISKAFCPCDARHFAKKPNTQVCPICLGLPGALPFVNQKAIDQVIKLGLSYNCEISKFSKFDRKHYFYPDLPKGYQISQYDLPLARNGFFKMGDKVYRIRRIHLEEDTAKMVHIKENGQYISLIDFNRSGVALAEMVTEPDFESSDEVLEFLKMTQAIVRHLDVSEADMEKGSMRLEANLSIGSRKILPDYKVELKNINSFRFLKNAIDYEINRQFKLLMQGKRVVQETRGYDEKSKKTFSQRQKEEAKDYRYFPEPDIPPLVILKEHLLKIKKEIPELPFEKIKKYVTDFGVKEEFAKVLAIDKERSVFFEKASQALKRYQIPPSEVARIMVNLKLDTKLPSFSAFLKACISLKKKKKVSGNKLEEVLIQVVRKEKKAVDDYKKGKREVLSYLVGRLKAELKQDFDPKEALSILMKVLKKI